MMTRSVVAWSLVAVGLLFGLAAAVLRFLSASHGHGLATTDRRMIALLIVSATFSVVLGIILHLRREG